MAEMPIPLMTKPPAPADYQPLEWEQKALELQNLRQQVQLRQVQAAQLGQQYGQQRGMNAALAAYEQENRPVAPQGQPISRLAQPALPPDQQPLTQTAMPGGSQIPPSPVSEAPPGAPPVPGAPQTAAPPEEEDRFSVASINKKHAFYDTLLQQFPIAAEPYVTRAMANDAQTLTMRKLRLEEAKMGVGMIAQLASSIQDAPEAEKPAVLRQTKAMAMQLGWPGAAQMPDTWNDEAKTWVDTHAMQARSKEQRIEQQIKAQEATSKMMDSYTKQFQARTERGKVRYEPTATGGLVQVPEYVVGEPGAGGGTKMLSGPPETGSRTPGTGSGAPGQGTPVMVNGQPVMMKAGRDQETTLRKEFTDLTKPYREVSDAFGRVMASKDDHTPVGDLSLIFSYMKLIDPGSTVREGERATAQNAGNIPQQIMGQYNRLIEGSGSLDVGIRADFVERAQRLYAQHTQDYEKVKTQYSTLATRQRLDPKQVTMDYTSTAPNPPLRVVPRATVQALMAKTGKTQAQVEQDLKAKQYRITE